ncbi:MAG: Gfo/Idh/MocA family oxidoreductase [Chloroflexi bacterium]|nr:Gfo/Idh/MocA family oxidoreductase [Chloroflexota bacterium]
MAGTPQRVRFGIIGGAAIAQRSVLPALQAAPSAEAVVLASRSEARRSEIAARFGLRTTASYDEVLDDPEVDAVYICLPNDLHEPWTLRALGASKHVYCEKPAVLDAAGAWRVASLARERRLVFLEGYMSLFHPQLACVRRLIEAGAIGEPRHFDGAFGFPPLNEDNIRYRAALGGGGLNDSAGYPLHAARRLLGGEPDVLGGALFRSPEREVDERGTALLAFPGGRTASVVFGIGFAYRNAYTVWGADGQISLERAYSAPPDHVPTIVLRDRNGREQTRLLEPADHFLLLVEAMASAIRGEQPYDAFLPDFEAIAALMDTLRRCATLQVVG